MRVVEGAAANGSIVALHSLDESHVGLKHAGWKDGEANENQSGGFYIIQSACQSSAMLLNGSLQVEVKCTDIPYIIPSSI